MRSAPYKPCCGTASVLCFPNSKSQSLPASKALSHLLPSFPSAGLPRHQVFSFGLGAPGTKTVSWKIIFSSSEQLCQRRFWYHTAQDQSRIPQYAHYFKWGQRICFLLLDNRSPQVNISKAAWQHYQGPGWSFHTTSRTLVWQTLRFEIAPIVPAFTCGRDNIQWKIFFSDSEGRGAHKERWHIPATVGVLFVPTRVHAWGSVLNKTVLENGGAFKSRLGPWGLCPQEGVMSLSQDCVSSHQNGWVIWGAGGHG